MTSDKFTDLCKSIVVNHFNSRNQKTLYKEDVRIVWFCKALQNFKALVISTTRDGIYYEITYDGDNGKIYLDVYKKESNQVINPSDVKDGGQ